MRILYLDRTAWADLSEEPQGYALDSREREALAAFSAALPNVPERIDLADGIGFFMLTSSGKWIYDEEPTMYAAYGLCVDVESPLPRS
jgi:hypothetical protein